MSNTKPANKPHASIISPVADFLMVGGVSLFVMPLLMLPIWQTESYALWLAFISYCLIFILNLPHFISSYQLLYRGYFQKLKDDVYSKASKARLLISGVIAPIFLAGFLIYGVALKERELLGYATNLMLFTLGWHYVKQGYGIMIALSVRKKVFFDTTEKNVLLANAYITWLFSFFLLNATVKQDVFHGIPFSTLGFSESLIMPLIIVYSLWCTFAAIFMFRKFDKHDTLCFNGLAAYFFSVYPWVLLVNAHPHFMIFVPALHSLQYLLCVWKLIYERIKSEAGEKKEIIKTQLRKQVLKRMFPFLFVSFSAGAVIFIAVPMGLDNIVNYDVDIFGPSIFVYCFTIFLNIHHYFIDFAIWRRDNPEMQLLFK